MRSAQAVTDASDVHWRVVVASRYDFGYCYPHLALRLAKGGCGCWTCFMHTIFKSTFFSSNPQVALRPSAYAGPCIYRLLFTSP